MLRRSQGFTLLEMSVVLLIIAVLAGSGAAILGATVQKRQLQETEAKMQIIQDALLKFRRAYNRLPCPADITKDMHATSTNQYGVEATTLRDCITVVGVTDIAANYSVNAVASSTTTSAKLTSGSPVLTILSGSLSGIYVGAAISAAAGIPVGTTVAALRAPGDVIMSANATATSGSTLTTFAITHTYVAGGVPTKTLGLPDEVGIDGWGRRMMYSVHSALTNNDGFTSVPVGEIGGATTRLVVNNAAGTAKTSLAAYVLVSHGPNGHGATPRGGGSTRIYAGSTNADEWNNCNCNATVATAFNQTFVQKPAREGSLTSATYFDDIVVYARRDDLRSATE